jgi:hypothetical protein
MMITAAHLVAKLRDLQPALDASLSPVICIRFNDPRFAWHSLPAPHCTIPGIDVGQDEDWRFATDGDEGLHAHVFRSRGVVEFHLDAVNVCGDAPGHAVADTHAVRGTIAGTMLGLLVGKIAGHPLIGSALGALGGALVGGHIPKRNRQVFGFEDLFSAGWYR